MTKTKKMLILRSFRMYFWPKIDLVWAIPTKVVQSIVKNVDHGVTTLISIVVLGPQNINKLIHNFTQQLNLVPEK